MNTVKKLAALLMALVLVLTLGVTALADGSEGTEGTDGTSTDDTKTEATPTTYTITIENTTTGHTYEAYQIFTGDLYIGKDGTGEDAKEAKILSNIVWGNGVTEAGKTALGSASDKADAIKTTAEAEAFAKEVAKYLNSANVATSTAGDGVYTISKLEPGYYLIKDKESTLSNKDDFYTAYMLKVVGDVTATPKGSKPTLEKKIRVGNDNFSDVMTGWIGTSVAFQDRKSVV